MSNNKRNGSFNTETLINLLPCDGVVNYYGKVITKKEAQYYFDQLLKSIQWRNDEVKIYGRHITTKRKVAWYGDTGHSYTYSQITRQALPWTIELLELKKRIENLSQTTFNSCLLNLYHNGDEGMGWHSDNEKELGENPVIASLSLGAERKFSLKHKLIKNTVSVLLETGSLLLMKSETQSSWLHALPKTKKVNGPRINLTFRTIVD